MTALHGLRMSGSPACAQGWDDPVGAGRSAAGRKPDFAIRRSSAGPEEADGAGGPLLLREWKPHRRPAEGRDAAVAHRTVIALGNFDGVHRGHQLLLAEVRRWARALGAQPAVMTPEPHPRAVLGGGGKEAFRLTTLRDKYRLLGREGIAVIFAPRFDRAFAGLTAEDFVEDVLLRGWRACHVVVGEDFRFGHRRQGDTDLLARLLCRRGVGLSVVPMLHHAGCAVSSRLIRQMIRAGDLGAAADLLGRAWEVSARISPSPAAGEARCRIALHLHRQLIRPPAGRYAVTVETAGARSARADIPPAFPPRACGLLEAEVSPQGEIRVEADDSVLEGLREGTGSRLISWRAMCASFPQRRNGRSGASRFTIPSAMRRQAS